MCPWQHGDGHDASMLNDESVQGDSALVENVGTGFGMGLDSQSLRELIRSAQSVAPANAIRFATLECNIRRFRKSLWFSLSEVRYN